MTQEPNIEDWTSEQIEDYLNGLALLSQLFWGPTPELAQEVAAGEVEADLARPAAWLGNGVRKAVGSLLDGAAVHLGPAALFESLENEYVALFINTREGISAPLYQSCYESEDGLMMGPAAQRMAQRLAQEGLAPSGQGSQPPDHLAAELEYLFLVLERGAATDSAEALEQARAFAREELSPWLGSLAQRLQGESHHRFYPAAARLALAWLGPLMH